jgi:hypothetical protein
MAKHQSFTVATNVKVYICDPQSPWQRGANENTNGLLRHYLPKKTDLSGYSQSDLDNVALRLNQRPRKTLGFETPASKLQTVLHRPVETAGLSETSMIELAECMVRRVNAREKFRMKEGLRQCIRPFRWRVFSWP